MPVAAIHAAVPSPSLAALRWRDRVVLVFASPRYEPQIMAQTRDLDMAKGGLRERDLRVVGVSPDRVTGLSDTAESLRRRFDIPDDGFAVLLIGKDGHVAYRSSRPVAAADLFARIDAMPMRREEMRRRYR